MRALVLILLLCSSGLAAGDLQLLRGVFSQSAYAALLVDARKSAVDLLVYPWPDYKSLDQLPKDCQAALNGTFFSLKWNEPAGILIYSNGRQRWTPKFKRLYGSSERRVASLPRWYIAVMADGRCTIGNSRGLTAGAVGREIGPVRVLLGGGGLLVSGGRKAISAQTLAREGFDERSGVRPSARVPRTAVGVDALHRMWWLTAESLSLSETADLCLRLGCRQAIFLDCGSSTAMKVGSWSRGQGRALPTWLVCRGAGAAHGTALGR